MRRISIALSMCMVLLVSITNTGLVFGQKGTMLSKSDNDPKAKKILDGIKKDFDKYKSVEIEFELELEMPQQPKELQKGKLMSQGKKFAVQMKDQEIYCDGKTVWFYSKSNKEVQINHFDENDKAGFLSPAELLKMYQNGDFVYAITGEATEMGATVTHIEFKPLDGNSEYSKMRLSIEKNTNKLKQFRVFSKDGSRYSLILKTLTPNKSFGTNTFVFNPKSIPGIYVEDLRI